MNRQVPQEIKQDPMYKFLLKQNQLMNYLLDGYKKGLHTLGELRNKLEEVAKETSKYISSFTTTQLAKFKAIKAYVDSLEPVQTEKRLLEAKSNNLEKLEKNALKEIGKSKEIKNYRETKPTQQKENNKKKQQENQIQI